MSAQANRRDFFNTTFNLDRRLSVTANENRQGQQLFTQEQMENLKLNNLRSKRKQLQDRLKLVSNKINFRRKKEENELRKFIQSEEKSLNLMETHNYKKFKALLKDEIEQKNQFQQQKKAKQVQSFRINTHRRLSIIQQAVKEKKIEESQKLRHSKRMDEENLKYSRDMANSLKKQQHQSINKMKQRQNNKKKCYWYEKRISFQQKLLEQAQIYEKEVENYYRKIQQMKQHEEQLKQQQQQAQQVFKVAQQNFDLLKQS